LKNSPTLQESGAARTPAGFAGRHFLETMQKAAGEGKLASDLVAHCSPTLAGLKTANLFGYRFSSREILARDVRAANIKLNPKGVFVEILCVRKCAQILVYRLSRLAADLAQDAAREFLEAYGYRTNSIDDCIARLKQRFLSPDGFPHEVGLFLGYPLPDVIDFIKHQGKNSKCTGCWQVYHDEREAEKLFEKYRRCKAVYSRLFLQGKPIERLIVAG